MKEREKWATKLGLILAMAGNAIGLGNFLRFPVQAAQNGGGAFMIPYFISFLLLGIPLMWIEWSIGRYGGTRGHGTTPRMLHYLWNNPIAKYLGLLGLIGPFIIVAYYIYIESWTLAFSFFSLFGKLPTVPAGATVETALRPYESFFKNFVGSAGGSWFLRPSVWAYFFFLITMVINIYVLRKGISGGIEKLAKIAMPTLFIFAIILAVRVWTLGSPISPEYSSMRGLDFLWRPDFSALSNWKIWLAAAGQIFFTLSLGMGIIHTYASYLREDDDITASGLATASVNEFAEVVLGGSIAIPAAVAFFGVVAAQNIAKSGAFSLGFYSMPAVLMQMPLGWLFGFLWFGLLFFAGITSSVALTQPAIAFLVDEFGWIREKAATTAGIALFIVAQIPILLQGALDEMDFWMGTLGLALFALIETVLFVWVFGLHKGWDEMHKGALLRVPRFFYFIMKYITPLMLIIIIGAWFVTQWIPTILKSSPTIWVTRIIIVLLFVIGAILVNKSFKRESK